jgi:hypothetical protein
MTSTANRVPVMGALKVAEIPAAAPDARQTRLSPVSSRIDPPGGGDHPLNKGPFEPPDGKLNQFDQSPKADGAPRGHQPDGYGKKEQVDMDEASLVHSGSAEGSVGESALTDPNESDSRRIRTARKE